MVRRAMVELVGFLITAAAVNVAAGVEGAAAARPPTFEPNRGQVAGPAPALGRFGSLTVHIDERSLVFRARDRDGAPVSAGALAFVGARRVTPVLETALPGRVNYLLGDDPSRWVRNIPTYSRLRYPGLWPGIDLVLRSDGARLEYDVVVHPGGDPRAAALRFDGVSALARSGEALELTTPAGIVRHSAPRILQVDAGGEREIAGDIVVEGTTLRFAVASFDRSLPLLIDPIIELAAPVAGFWEAAGLAVDGAGNAFVAGSADEPRGDAMVVKLDRAGAVVFTTFVGGSGTDLATDVAVDAQGRAILVGTTNSVDFPRVAAAQSAHGGKWDAFVVTLSVAGDDLVSATPLGGSDDDYGSHAAAVPGGGCVLAGWSTSRDFPVTSGAFDRSCGSDGWCNLTGGYPTRDAVIAKLGGDGKLAYCTYLGGEGMEDPYDVAVDGSGRAVVVGTTSSASFPTKSSIFPASSGSFVTRLASDGSGLSYSTGFPGMLSGVAIAADSGVVVGGWAPREALPAAQKLGPGEGLVAALSPSGASLQWSTYLGAKHQSFVRSLAIAADGRVHAVGDTRGDGMPLAMPFQMMRAGSQDGFVATVAAGGAGLALSTYLGSVNDDYLPRAVVDPQGALVVLAIAYGDDFPGGAAGPNVVRIGTGNESADLSVTLTDDHDPVLYNSVVTYTATVNASGSGTATAAVATFLFSSVRPWTITATRGTCVSEFHSTGLSRCDFGDLAPGDVVTVEVKGYAIQEGDSTCRAVVSSLTGDRNPGDNVAVESTFVSPSVNLAVVQWDSADPVEVGEQITYVADIHLRDSRWESSGVDLVDTLPPGVELLGAISDRGPCTVDGGTVRCELAEVGQWTMTRVAITVRSMQPGVICNRVTAVGAELEPDYTDNTATECTTAFAREPGEWRTLIAGVAHNPGAGGTLWRTDVTLVNPTDRALTAALRFRTPALDLARTIELAASGAVDLPNVLESAFGIGASESRSGSLEVRAETALVVTSRTYNLTAKGSLGDLYPAVHPGQALAYGQRGVIPGVQRGEYFRTNLGAVNLGEHACSLRVTLLDSWAREVGTATPRVAPGMWWQQFDALTAFGQEVGDATTVTVEPLDEGCLIWVYASLIDAHTGDPTNIPALRPTEWTVRGGWEEYSYYLPAAAHLDGANGTVWRTDVFRVWPKLYPWHWATPSMHELFFCQYPTFDPGIGGGSYPDWLDTRADVGFMGLVGPNGSDLSRKPAGTYKFLTSLPALGWGRTYNQTADGSFGQLYPFLTSRDGVAPGQLAFLAPLRKSAAYRTNLGFQNVTKQQCEVRASFFTADGAAVGTPRTWTLQPERWLQQNDVLGSAGVGRRELAYAVVEVLTPGCRVWPYASVIDNVSGDPVTVSATVVGR